MHQFLSPSAPLVAASNEPTIQMKFRVCWADTPLIQVSQAALSIRLPPPTLMYIKPHDPRKVFNHVKPHFPPINSHSHAVLTLCFSGSVDINQWLDAQQGPISPHLAFYTPGFLKPACMLPGSWRPQHGTWIRVLLLLLF